MNDGIYPDLSFADYRALSRYGSSDIKAMRLGPPARVKWDRENPRRDTDATVRGTAAHCLVLTPALFGAQFIEKPAGMEFRSNENKKWRDDHLAAGRTILAADEWAAVRSIATAVVNKAPVLASLEGAGREQSLLWTCPDSGVSCKGRPDWYDDEYVYDLKVTRDAGPRLAFKAYINGWWHQLAHYRFGLHTLGLTGIRTGRIVAVHPDAPHYVHCIEARVADLDVLTLENVNTLGRIRECEESGNWPGTPDEFERVEIPQYALQEVVALADAEEVNDG